MSESCQPVISLLDMDCFYVQVEARDQPRLAGVPAAVVQYNTWKGGGIIAVNYEARAKGVSRSMRGEEAREKCPEIELVTVPERREKADLSKYRRAGREVIEVLLDSGATVERASIDEAYLDLSALVDTRLARGEAVTIDQLPNTWLGGQPGHTRETLEVWCQQAEEGEGDDMRLAVGAKIMEEVRAEVYRRTQFRCSAGISHCKTLAKLCCGLNKPNKQTVLPHSQLSSLYQELRLTKVRGLGGKLGESVVTLLGVQTMAELAQLPLIAIGAKFEAKTAHWLYMLGRGRDGEVVKERELPKSIGCGKNFRGKEKLATRQRVEEKVKNLVEELIERLEEDKDEYNRQATGLTVGVNMEGEGHVSRAASLQLYSMENILTSVMTLLARLNTARDRHSWSPALLNVSISAGKFVSSGSCQSRSITAFFSAAKPAMTVTRPRDSRTVITEPQNVPKSFFKMKILEDLEKKKKSEEASKTEISESSSSAVIEGEGDGNEEESIRGEKSKQEDSIVEKQQEAVEKNSVIDVAELIPSLSTFDPSILDFLPPKLQQKARERVNLLKEKENKSSKAGSMASFFTSSAGRDVEDVEDCVECEVCHKNVSAFTLPEHLDWHYAVSLSKQSNAGTDTKKVVRQPTGKRKRDPPSAGEHKETGKKSKKTDISKFFIKS